MKIMILVNKDFEYAGYRAGVEHQMLANVIPSFKVKYRDWSIGPNKFDPSSIYNICGCDESVKHHVREFCISYLFGENENTSNSQQKLELVKTLIAREKPEYIISVSTSESTLLSQKNFSSVNGCVFIGDKFYAKDCRSYDPTTKSHLDVPPGWNVENPPICTDFYDFIKKNQGNVTNGMVKVPNSPACKLAVYADNAYVSLGVINVMDYSCYDAADPATYEEFITNYNITSFFEKDRIPVGLETTHAIVKMAAGNIPVLFVSPIVDRYESFDIDVDGKWGQQNAMSSYNAGVVVANMLELLKDKI